MGLRLSLDDSLFLLLCFLVLTLNLPGPLFSAPTNMLPVYLSITQTFDYSLQQCHDKREGWSVFVLSLGS